jgi:signal transduction histidine kinase
MSLTGWSKLRKGIRFRLTLINSALFGLFLLSFAYILSSKITDMVRSDFDASLVNYAIDLSEAMTDQKFKIVLKVPPSERKKSFHFSFSQTFYAIRNISGKILIQSENQLPFKEIPYDPTLSKKADYTHRHLTFRSKRDTYRVINLKVTDSSGRELILQVASLYNELLAREKKLLIVIFTLIPILVVVAGFFSFMIAANVMAPIKNLMATANQIAASNLSMRVTEPDTEDDVAELSKTLNNLLERLEKSFRGQENFVANASHQLNTPLAIIKGELDVFESKVRSSSELKAFHESLREELDRLIELVKKMLLVSRVESGLDKFSMSPLRLDDLLITIISRLQMKAKNKKLVIQFNIDENLDHHQLIVHGEKQLLDSLFENLIDNALKYTPENSTVKLQINRTHLNSPEVSIRDDGPGFRPEFFEQMLKKRFIRVDELGSHGNGIGLHLANQIAQFHGAKLLLIPKSQENGTHLVVSFPATN